MPTPAASSYLDLLTEEHRTAFRQPLPDWYHRVKRDMPWRQTDDPYRIWVSEVMLQQTRVDQAEPYFHRFITAFPTVEDLASASVDDVLKQWEGLGYYSRARNLHQAAQRVVNAFDGTVPDTYDEIRSLRGVGPYTAAAVLSIAYDKPHAVLDGNVIRVLTRVFALDDDAKSSRTRRFLQELADALIPEADPGDYNQAVMELGATVCTPTKPTCPACPLQTACQAYADGNQEDYPVSRKKAPVPHHTIVVGLVLNGEGDILIQRRPEDAMLGGLWEFPGGKKEDGETLEATCVRELQEELGVHVAVGAPLVAVDHAYSHFKITLHAFSCRIVDGTPESQLGIPLRWVSLEDLEDYAFPRANRKVIEALLAHQAAPSLFDEQRLSEADSGT